MIAALCLTWKGGWVWAIKVKAAAHSPRLNKHVSFWGAEKGRCSGASHRLCCCSLVALNVLTTHPPTPTQREHVWLLRFSIEETFQLQILMTWWAVAHGSWKVRLMFGQQVSLNINVNKNHNGILIQCKCWLCSYGVEAEILISDIIPRDADATRSWIRLWQRKWFLCEQSKAMVEYSPHSGPCSSTVACVTEHISTPPPTFFIITPNQEPSNFHAQWLSNTSYHSLVMIVGCNRRCTIPHSGAYGQWLLVMK